MVKWEKRFCEACGKEKTHRVVKDYAECWSCATKKEAKQRKQFEENFEENIEEEKHPELQWKSEIRDVLDCVGIFTPYSNSMETYNELLRRHKRVFGDKHDYNWLGLGMGASRSQLDTYLLIKIHNMMKCLMEKGTLLEKDFYQEETENEENSEWEAKEDFNEIKFSELPKDFQNQINKENIKKCFVNSEGIYRVLIEDEPIKEKRINATMNYLMDYNPKSKKKFCFH